MSDQDPHGILWAYAALVTPEGGLRRDPPEDVELLYIWHHLYLEVTKSIWPHQNVDRDIPGRSIQTILWYRALLPTVDHLEPEDDPEEEDYTL